MYLHTQRLLKNLERSEASFAEKDTFYFMTGISTSNRDSLSENIQEPTSQVHLEKNDKSTHDVR